MDNRCMEHVRFKHTTVHLSSNRRPFAKLADHSTFRQASRPLRGDGAAVHPGSDHKIPDRETLLWGLLAPAPLLFTGSRKGWV